MNSYPKRLKKRWLTGRGPVKKPGSQWENHDLTILLRSFDEILPWQSKSLMVSWLPSFDISHVGKLGNSSTQNVLLLVGDMGLVGPKRVFSIATIDASEIRRSPVEVGSQHPIIYGPGFRLASQVQTVVGLGIFFYQRYVWKHWSFVSKLFFSWQKP